MSDNKDNYLSNKDSDETLDLDFLILACTIKYRRILIP